MTESVERFPLKDLKGAKGEGVKTPTVFVARGFERHLPKLASLGRPIVCISDWQCDPQTQCQLWGQALRILQKQVGAKPLQSALVLVAGDMASKGNMLRGTKSDDAPDFSWIQESFPKGDIHIVYGNHDLISSEHLHMKNESGLPCLLPHGGCVGLPSKDKHYDLVGSSEINAILNQDHTQSDQDQELLPLYLQGMTKKEQEAFKRKQFSAKKKEKSSSIGQQHDHNPEQGHLVKCFQQMQSLVEEKTKVQDDEVSPLLVIGGVHGIPADCSEGMQKLERNEYFRVLDQVCAFPIDILVTHAQPRLPGQQGHNLSCLPAGQEHVMRGEEPQKMYDSFAKSQACLHVCGHRHMDPPVSVVAEGKVIVNADCRVVVFCFEKSSGENKKKSNPS